jgi:RimJ/RimL family protein N-acetyltransferase
MDAFAGRNVVLRPVRPPDAAFIHGLRSDPARSAHVSPVSGGVRAQEEWIARYLEREAAGAEYYFVIERGGAALGTVRLYDFRGDSFCWGSWMTVAGAPASVALESALLVYELAFYRLGFRRSHFDVRVRNERVVAFHVRFGARIVRSDARDHFFEFSREDYERARARYARLLPDAPPPPRP